MVKRSMMRGEERMGEKETTKTPQLNTGGINGIT